MKPTKSNSDLVGASRLFWVIIGPAILLLLALSIANKGSGRFTPHDIVYLSVLALMMLARWYEFRDNPTTSTGEPATPADLRKYLIGSMAVGIGMWGLAKLVGNYY